MAITLKEQLSSPGGVLKFLVKYNTVFIFLLLVLFSALISDVFFTSVNLSNLLKQVSGIGIISIGMLIVILTGGIDLSVGSMVALLAVTFAILVNIFALPLAILMTLAIGFGLGSISGYLVAYQKMAPFVATLALMTIARGLGFIYSKGSPVTFKTYGGLYMSNFANNSTLGIPNIAIVFFIIVGITMVMLRYNVFGRLIIAIGSNEEASRLSGIKVNKYKFLVYAISGTLAATAAIIVASRTNLGSPNMGMSWELDAIAAVVIGGASLNGGKGTAINTLMGVLILGLIGNILNLLNVPSYPQQVVKGGIIIFAVLLQRFERK
ncbi:MULTISPECIES: ABC transporter permease [Cellulophaga]|uniref:ABC-type transporter, integral membrane subunit n=2 Tax=Cellulophaga TaxID=104264 RepID=F0RC37_CELLC|nr:MULTISPECIES: ABC transporter permease [Cellulophaga]ADY30701.1 ABC-type transporter, integral membrane subunit [Cellulophaga lytica DSM 7489]AIM61683.1 sugar ABC transporter permease [Cellulophaga lytica]EWH14745.1 ABC transporter [Cellulophaga geojensis KL-A]MDO6852588.1 ABC transporter permease [Cellulophaga lytica]TVZ09987.1 ribose transport system permease protein [Cellulophaga sp. RHA_52]